MSVSDVTVATWKGDSTLVRARFGPGMLLQHEDLEYLGNYPRELSRLLFRSFFGCGVVCGLVVTVEEKCGKVHVTVGSGVALACSGDPIWVPKPQTVTIEKECDNVPTPLWVVLCPAAKCCAPRPSSCGDDDEESPSVCTRERDGFEIRIVSEQPTCVCGCTEIAAKPPGSTPPPAGGGDDDFLRVPAPPRDVVDCFCADPTDLCHAQHYAGICGCKCGDCPDCECQCVLLAFLAKQRDPTLPPWRIDHSVRRFIRPVLMRDPQPKPIEMVAPVKPAAAVKAAPASKTAAARTAPAPKTAAASGPAKAVKPPAASKRATSPKPAPAEKPATPPK